MLELEPIENAENPDNDKPNNNRPDVCPKCGHYFETDEPQEEVCPKCNYSFEPSAEQPILTNNEVIASASDNTAPQHTPSTPSISINSLLSNKIIIAVMLIAVYLTYSSCTGPGIKDNIYTNSELGFSIQIPDGWIESDLKEPWSPNVDIEFIYESPTNIMLTFMLGIGDMKGNLALAIIEDNKERLGVKIINEHKKTIDGFTIHELSFKVDIKTGYIITIPLPENFILIQFESINREKDQLKDYKNSIINSIRRI